MQSWCTSNDSFAFISRVYNGMAQDELLTLSTCVLIDEFEAGLKSMEDYKAALNHTFHSALPLHDFCKLFVIPLPGGWPTWYYTKKNNCSATRTKFPRTPLFFPYSRRRTFSSLLKYK